MSANENGDNENNTVHNKNNTMILLMSVYKPPEQHQLGLLSSWGRCLEYRHHRMHYRQRDLACP